MIQELSCMSRLSSGSSDMSCKIGLTNLEHKVGIHESERTNRQNWDPWTVIAIQRSNGSPQNQSAPRYRYIRSNAAPVFEAQPTSKQQVKEPLAVTIITVTNKGNIQKTKKRF